MIQKKGGRMGQKRGKEREEKWRAEGGGGWVLFTIIEAKKNG